MPPEARQFDFWIGEWDLTWKGGKGSNTITAILDSAVIQEVFDAPGFKGRSLSTFHRRKNQWHQTWVDNTRGYLDFVGGMEGDRMILSRTAKTDTSEFLQRMMFYNITADSLDWNWEQSNDEGKTWKLMWQIKYKRKQTDAK